MSLRTIGAALLLSVLTWITLVLLFTAVAW